jgi:hypothetical protein
MSLTLLFNSLCVRIISYKPCANFQNYNLNHVSNLPYVDDVKQLWENGGDEGSEFQILNAGMGFEGKNTCVIGHAIAEVVRSWLLTVELWDQPP